MPIGKNPQISQITQIKNRFPIFLFICVICEICGSSSSSSSSHDIFFRPIRQAIRRLTRFGIVTEFFLIFPHTQNETRKIAGNQVTVPR